MFNKIKYILWLLLLIPIQVFAYSDYIYAGGENVYIDIKSGVSIVGMYDINNVSPGIDAGLNVGDVIVSVDDINIENIKDLTDRINNALDGDIKIGYLRDNIVKYTKLNLVKEDDIYKTGLYVKDGIRGIGTLTYIDPNSKIYGALGHEIMDASGIRTNVLDGDIYASLVKGIKKSTPSKAGGKDAEKLDTKLGDIKENTIHGIFGKYTNEISMRKNYRIILKLVARLKVRG